MSSASSKPLDLSDISLVLCRPSRAPTLASTKQIGQLWIETAKIARKAGHSQTAYSAILQAQELEAAFVFVQSAKLLKTSDQTYKAIQAIDTALKPLIPPGFGKTPKEDSDLAESSHKGFPSPLAKVGDPQRLSRAFKSC